jgi:hypothetical protein
VVQRHYGLHRQSPGPVVEGGEDDQGVRVALGGWLRNRPRRH